MARLRKHLTPEEFGALLYETVREGVAATKELSMTGLLTGLELGDGLLSEQYEGEIVIACLFGATLALERSTPAVIRTRIVDGLQQEFVRHLGEQGALPEHCQEWREVFRAHFREYGVCLEGYDGDEPPWKLGRQFLWHLTGRRDHAARSIRHAALYLLRARDLAQHLINEHGPRLRLELPGGESGA
jgi:hypothetical protein